jgi:hypothetical protein
MSSDINKTASQIQKRNNLKNDEFQIKIKTLDQKKLIQEN